MTHLTDQESMQIFPTTDKQSSSPPCLSGDFNPIVQLSYNEASFLFGVSVIQLKRLSNSKNIKSRIGLIKRDFFMSRILWNLEHEEHGLASILVLIGLGSICDHYGIFLYRPCQIKQRILPYCDYSVPDTMIHLAANNLILFFKAKDTVFGYCPVHCRSTSITIERAVGLIKQLNTTSLINQLTHTINNSSYDNRF